MKRLINSILLIILFSLANTGIAETGKAPDPAAAKRGAKLYNNYCVSCHGVEAVGEPAPPPMLQRPGYFAAPALNGSGHTWHHTDENLLATIMQGSPRTKKMPAWKGVLSKKQVQDVIAYFKSLWPKRSLDCQGPKHMSCM